MAAYVACGASVTATLTADGGTGSTVDMAATIVGVGTFTVTPKRGGGVVWSRPVNVAGAYADMASTILGGSTITATAYAHNDTAALLLLLDLELTITEGVTL